jgi:hypothetical protein
MSRREPTLDPVAVRELEALDAGAAVDPDLTELAVLAQDLRAVAPRPTEEFAARLDERVAAGFPAAHRPEAKKRRRWSPPRMNLFTPLAAGSLAAVIAAVVVAAALLSGPGSDGGSPVASSDSAETSSGASVPSVAAPKSSESATGAPQASRDSGGAGPLGGSGSGTSGSSATDPGRRRVERSADLAVSVARDHFDEAAARVPQIAAGANAIVETSSVSTDGGDGRATFALRVPVDALEQTLADLSALGRVESRDESGVDVTGAYVSAADRLGDLRAERSSVRRRLAGETDTAKANELRDRLDELQRDIASARATVAQMRERTSYARVAFELTTARDGQGAGAGDDADQGWTIGDALSDAGSILAGVLSGLIVGLAVAAPLIALLAALVLGRAVLRRRRRERALGPA